jgi:WD40 repeat protein
LADSLLLVSRYSDKTLWQWDLYAGAAICAPAAGDDPSSDVESIEVSPDGQLIAFALGSTIKYWNTVTHEQIYNLDQAYESSVRFFSDGSRIVTDRGALPLPRCFLADSTTNMPANAACLLYVKDQWLTCNTKKLLWLPFEYRTCPLATQGNTIAFGPQYSSAFFLTFDLQNRPLWV